MGKVPWWVHGVSTTLFICHIKRPVFPWDLLVFLRACRPGCSPPLFLHTYLRHQWQTVPKPPQGSSEQSLKPCCSSDKLLEKDADCSWSIPWGSHSPPSSRHCRPWPPLPSGPLAGGLTGVMGNLLTFLGSIERVPGDTMSYAVSAAAWIISSERKEWVRTKPGELCCSSTLPKGVEEPQRDLHPQAGPSAASEFLTTRMIPFYNKNVNVYISICTEQLFSVPISPLRTLLLR